LDKRRPNRNKLEAAPRDVSCAHTSSNSGGGGSYWTRQRFSHT